MSPYLFYSAVYHVYCPHACNSGERKSIARDGRDSSVLRELQLHQRKQGLSQSVSGVDCPCFRGRTKNCSRKTELTQMGRGLSGYGRGLVICMRLPASGWAGKAPVKMTRKVVPFFCDQCGRELSTGYACPVCKRILCNEHYASPSTGRKRRDGLCPVCAAKKETGK